ncbi:hypothetical protein Tco_1066645 [Tanacetum coccineum]|uniref:Uncharacterized protein n=1 Tax=Tanacetum coccineum TaxID=301880 RepID=A0ABQ5HB18_9ASTR
MSDMTSCLNDLSYIPPNNEQNEPTQGDIDNKDVHFCPVCNTSRWKDSNTPGKKVPKKCTEPGKMQHPVDGRAWNNFDTKYSDYAKEPRNVRLGLAADGFNPFDNLSQSYSMWSVILTTYNLPPQLCMKESSLMLMLLIPGPKSPGKDIDVYLSSVSGWSGQGYKACPTCNEDTPSMRVLGKIVYVGHKRFLKKPHKWRRSLDFNGETKDGDPPRKFDRDQIMAQLARLPTRVKDVARSHGSDGDGNDRPPPHQMGGGCRGNGTRKPNLGGRKAGRLNICKETQNLGLRRITDLHGPQPIICGVLDALPFLAQHLGGEEGGGPRKDWDKINKFISLSLSLCICLQPFDLNPHINPIPRTGEKSIRASNTFGKDLHEQQVAYEVSIGFLTPKTGLTTRNTLDPDVRQTPPRKIGIAIFLVSDPKNAARVPKGKEHSGVICRQGSRSLDVPPRYADAELRYSREDMLRLQGLGSNTPSGVPYTGDEIMANVRWGNKGGTFPCWSGFCATWPWDVHIRPASKHAHRRCNETIKKQTQLMKQMGMIIKIFRRDDKMSPGSYAIHSQPNRIAAVLAGPGKMSRDGEDAADDEE